nr:carboxymuconolactone decarboxylase family protein [Rhodococcus sp. P14]
MLAVTEVNGCGACSYAHTKIALGAGMSSAEIRNILAGVLDDVPDSEVAAVLFAQHYADTRATPRPRRGIASWTCTGSPPPRGSSERYGPSWSATSTESRGPRCAAG